MKPISAIDPLLSEFMMYAIKNNASDIHLSANEYPMLRVDGVLLKIPNTEVLNGQILIRMLHSVMSPLETKTYQQSMELDFSIKSEPTFRVNAFNTFKGPAAVFRKIPSHAPTLEEIFAPTIFNEICKLDQGLVLIVGPTGSGKSTTLSAIVRHINDNYKKHIITIEDPIELVHKSNLSLINQREVGSSTISFPNALRSALREDPDIIVVGEMRDLETIRLALTAAETGHLVIATMHTKSAAQSVNRIIDVFPVGDKEIVRSMVAYSLVAVISQRLFNKIGGGRVAGYEIMVANNSIKNLIQEDRIPQINSMIEIGKKQGLTTLTNAVTELFNKRIITQETLNEFMESIY
jgi:twitching motility protein PilT